MKVLQPDTKESGRLIGQLEITLDDEMIDAIPGLRANLTLLLEQARDEMNERRAKHKQRPLIGFEVVGLTITGLLGGVL